ncbi:nuclear transport factor 2 family protein [Sphingobium sp. HBC34]|uniref:Nuclear transport factor 2 family protein n=1 Tax=Sphingobium cyanobacteriorum TaxID=3063954 RepID=A0ABT8ZQ80_9SPHN|nr:nuclear transport factor 2 family protein [Sphingobium sp. HBC34]MDO7836704.1 nuclear transport factor 2 family protein [Sphingobium sp. HBC34]
MILAGDDDPVEHRLAALECRVRDLEDRQAIYQLVASYGLAADGMSREGLERLWAPDGRYDTEHHIFEGAQAVGAIVEDPMHLGFVEPGCAHVMSLPHVTVTGNSAVATNYSRVYLRSGEEWRVVRVAANRWELTRDEAGLWRVDRRINRLLDGTAESRALLAQGLCIAQ